MVVRITAKLAIRIYCVAKRTCRNGTEKIWFLASYVTTRDCKCLSSCSTERNPGEEGFFPPGSEFQELMIGSCTLPALDIHSLHCGFTNIVTQFPHRENGGI